LRSFGELTKQLQAHIEEPPADVIEQIIDLTRYEAYLNDGGLQAEDKLENLGVLVAEARAYTDIDTFLEEMALMSSTDGQADDQQRRARNGPPGGKGRLYRVYRAHPHCRRPALKMFHVEQQEHGKADKKPK
jgi:superfamily I DNA/RNA helicase